MTQSFSQFFRCALLASLTFLLVSLPGGVQADSPEVTVQIDISKAGPRAVEPETERRIVSDYRLAWTSLAQAMESNAAAPLQALFVGQAEKRLRNSVSSQQKAGLTTRYLNQHHKLQAVFYSPEGDVIELHDTAQYRMQLLDGSKLIHDDNGTHYFVVLMTPGADRWVVRELTAVPQF
jgi:hypothetical protein